MKSARRFVVGALLVLAVLLFATLVAFSLGVMVKGLMRSDKPELAQIDD